jgi:hypothetical protein
MEAENKPNRDFRHGTSGAAVVYGLSRVKDAERMIGA